MDLKDLANEERVARAHPSRAASPAKQPEPAAKTSWSVGPPGVRWRVLKSRLLDDEPILIVFGKRTSSGVAHRASGQAPPTIWREYRGTAPVPR